MALGLLAASGQLKSDRFCDYAVVGELALDGSTRAVKGALSMAMATAACGKRGLVIPRQNGAEAAVGCFILVTIRGIISVRELVSETKLDRISK